MSAYLRALRAILRFELRQYRAQRGRAILLILLVAVPVAALVGGSAIVSTTRATLEERRNSSLGSADLRVQGKERLEMERLLEALPESAHIQRLRTNVREVFVPGRRMRGLVHSIENPSPGQRNLGVGLLRLMDGTLPENAQQLALAPSLLAELELNIGDSVSLDGLPKEICGVVVDPEDTAFPVMLVGWEPSSTIAVHVFLVGLDRPATDLQKSGSKLSELRQDGWVVDTRLDIDKGDSLEEAVLFVIGGFGLFEAALVISAAFGVSLHRRQREIGLLGASGASTHIMRQGLCLSGLALAFAGCLIGSAFGVFAAWLLHPHLDDWTGRLNGPLEVEAWPMLCASAMGLFTALVAIRLPVVRFTQAPVRAALAGRRPTLGRSGGSAIIGGLLFLFACLCMWMAAGIEDRAAILWILASSLAGILSLALLSPWLLGICARAAGPLPLAWRLAVRDAGRFRRRNGPVVTAVCAGMSLSVLVGGLVASLNASTEGGFSMFRRDQLLVEGPAAEQVALKIASQQGSLASSPLRAAYFEGQPVQVRLATTDQASSQSNWLAWGDSLALLAAGATRAQLPMEFGPAVRSIVSSASVQTPPQGSASVVLSAEGTALRATLANQPIEVSERMREARYFLDPTTARSLGFTPGRPPGRSLAPWVVRMDRPVDVPLLRSAQAIASQAPGTSVVAQVTLERSARQFLSVVSLLCFVTGMIVILIATSLSAVESAADEHILQTIGASPAVLCRNAAARAGYLAFLGCVLAVPAGLIPLVGLLQLGNLSLTYILPVRELLLTLLGLPLLAYVVSWTLGVLKFYGSKLKPGDPRPVATQFTSLDASA